MSNVMSLRTRLFLLIVIPLIAIAVLAATARYWFAAQTSHKLYDETLSVVALTISRDVVLSGGDILADELLDRLRVALGDPIYYRVTGPSGRFVTGYSEAPSGVDVDDLETGKPIFYDSVYLGDQVRAVVFREFISDSEIGGWMTVQVWQTVTERNRLIQQLLLQAIAIMSVVIASAGLLVWFGIRRGLRPLTHFRQAIVERSPEDLHPIKRALPTEIAPIVDATNNLFKRLSDELEQREVFISNAAHQLRNPIAGIQAMAEAGETAPTEKALRVRMKLLADAARSTSRLTTQLLSLDRVTAKSRENFVESINLVDLVSEVVSRHAPAALRKDIDVSFDAEPSDIMVSCDPVTLAEAVDNLIDNALKYGMQGSAELQVAVGIDGAEATTMVSDNGPGISEEQRSEIFDRFNRGKEHQVAGSGLGLSIVKAVAERYGGTVALVPSSQGACFELRLPRA